MFFISFLLRNNVFMDKKIDDGLRKALEVVTLAKKELPASFAIGKALPDLFSEGCQELWGAKLDTIYVGTSTPMEVEETPDPIAESVSRIVEEQGIDLDKMESSTPLTWGNTANSEPGWGSNPWGYEAPDDGADSGWGNSADNEDTATGWGAAYNDGPNPWEVEATWNTGDAKSLTTLLGPTAFPLTHTTGIVEDSTRKIKAILPPQFARKAMPSSSAEAVEAELETKFGKMVMAPWLDWDPKEKSDFNKPSFNLQSRGPALKLGEEQPVDGVHAHDATRDEISVLVEPSVLKELVEGMGIGATWVQIARSDSDGKPVPGAPNMWYLERVTQLIPSYYIDP
jgi:hypothetical protein